MCRLQHLRIKSIDIASKGLYAGQTTHENPFQVGSGRGVDLFIHTRMKLEKVIMVCLAGALAQEKYAPRDSNSDYGGSMDIDTAFNLAMKFFMSKKVASAYMAFAEAWARQQFENPSTWAAVERLAQVLLQQGKISGRRAEVIIGGRSVSARKTTSASQRRHQT